jgi:3-methylcrotonyl-CoA carboxylase alpha subunit
MQVFAAPACDADDDVRLDTGVRVGNPSGDEISVYYDPMIAKLITWGGDREEAIRRMQGALATTEVIGVKTNLEFLQQLVRHPAFIDGATDTGFIARHRAQLLPAQATVPDLALIAAALRELAREESGADDRRPGTWDSKSGWWLNRGATRSLEFHTEGGEGGKGRGEHGDNKTDSGITVHVDHPGVGRGSHLPQLRIAGRQYQLSQSSVQGDTVRFTANGSAHTATVLAADAQFAVLLAQSRHRLRLVDPFHFEASEEVNDGRLTAMMPGRVVKVMAAAGDPVKKGQALIIMEAMKMEHTIVSPRDGIIERVAFAVGEMVPADAVLFAFVANADG